MKEKKKKKIVNRFATDMETSFSEEDRGGGTSRLCIFPDVCNSLYGLLRRYVRQVRAYSFQIAA